MIGRLGKEVGYHHVETVTSGNTSAPVVIPPTRPWSPVTVAAIPTAATALVQTTTSSDAAVVAGTATWVNWSQGSVTVTTQDSLQSPVTGIRLTSTGGSTVLEIVA